MEEFVFHSKKGKETQGTVTVVGLFSEEFGLILGVSRCSPKDSFSKKFGRTLALGRLDYGIVYMTFPLTSCSVAQFLMIARGVAMDADRNLQKIGI